MADNKSVDISRKTSVEDVQLEKAVVGYGTWNGVNFTHQDYLAANRKVDFILLSTLVLYYFLSFLDRGNIGNAKVAGLAKDLHISSNQYALALTLTFIPYILIELPSNLYLKKLGAHRVLPTLVCLWGLVTCMQGFVTSYSGLLACRFFIGLLEGGLTPGSILVLSSFYRKAQFQKRTAFFFGMIQLAGAFSGLLAYVIVHNLEGKAGHRGWRYIFWIEGAMSIVLGLATSFLVPASPASAWWLTETQTAALLANLAADNSEYKEVEPVNIRDACSVWWTNISTSFHLGQYATNGFFTFGLTYFAAPIVGSLGTFSTVKTQLMTVPPYVLGFVLAISTAVMSDYWKKRGIFCIFAGVLGVVGFVLNLTSHKAHIRYGALFLQLGAGAVQTPSIAAWGVNNASGHQRRGAHIAGCFATTNAMGMVSVWLFPVADAPYYRTGSIVGTVAAAFMLVLPIALIFSLKKENARRDQELAKIPADHVFPDAMDDRDVRFRFMY